MIKPNLSLGFPTRRDSNQSLQLQRLARKMMFHLKQVFMVLSKKQITEALISLNEPLLFALPEDRFSHVMAHILSHKDVQAKLENVI